MGCIFSKKVSIDRILRVMMVFKCFGVKCHYVSKLLSTGTEKVHVCESTNVTMCVMSGGNGYMGACSLVFPLFCTFEIFKNQKCREKQIVLNVFLLSFRILFHIIAPVKKKAQVVICLYSVFLDVIQQKNSEILWIT